MNIAIFTETYLPFINGIVTHVRLLREGLEKLGHSVLIVTADPSARHHWLDGSILRCPALPLKKIYGYGFASPVSASRLRYLYRFKPDIIHIHNEFAVGFFGMQAAMILGLPMVYTIHTMYDDYLHYVAPSGMTYVLDKTITFYLKQITRQACAVIGPSAKVEALCKRHGIHKKIHLIRNCPDLGAFHPENANHARIDALKTKYGISPDLKVLVSTSRIAKEKSLDVILSYFGRCFARDMEYRLIIVGDGPALEELKELAMQLNLADRVLFTGAVPNAEVPDYCHLGHLFVSASLTEMFSIAMLEALAAGLPAIIRRDVVNKGQIEHGRNGFVFDDEGEFEQHIRGFFALPSDRRGALVASTIASVASYGSMDLAEEVVAVYQEAQTTYAKRPYSRITTKVKGLRGTVLRKFRSQRLPGDG